MPVHRATAFLQQGFLALGLCISFAGTSLAATTSPDQSKPVVQSFKVPAVYAAFNVPVTEYTASDDIAVAGYLITNSNSTPSSSDPQWSPAPPRIYRFLTNGDKTLYAWAKDASGNVSDPVQATVAVNAPRRDRVAKIHAGGGSFAISSDGTLMGWGNNVLSPMVVPGNLPWKDVTGFYYQFMGINDNGGLCDLSFFPYAAQCSTTDTWEQVDSGFYFNVGIKSDGTLWSWGSTTGHEETMRVGTDSDWLKVAAGAGHAVALKSDGTLWAWGANDAGQIGDGTLEKRTDPVRIDNASDWVDIDAKEQRSLALKADGSLWTWGKAWTGEHLTPFRVGDENSWAGISTGYAHNAAIKTDGTLWGWGVNYYGELGSGDYEWQYSPVRAGADSDWIKASAGIDYSLGEKADATVWAWGKNIAGELGDGTTTNRLTPGRTFSLGSSITFNDGSNYTRSPEVAVWLSDFPGWVRMQFSETGLTWSYPEPYSPLKYWTFAAGEGVKHLQVRYQNVAGQWLGPYAASVTLDTTAPRITINTPAEDSTTDQGAVSVSGTIDEVATVKMRIGPGSWVPAVVTGNTFNLQLSLSPGTNLIEIVAADAAGNQAVASRTITHYINGSCGSSNGGTFATLPTGGLCDAGGASAVSLSATSWKWSCNGSYGGTAATCSAFFGMPLTLTFAGTGGGSVNGDLSCTSAAGCSGTILKLGSTASLVAIPDRTSIFNSWGGACSGSGTCTVTMDAAKSVTASFDKAPPAVTAGRGFKSLTDAYAAAGSTATILTIDSVLPDAGLVLEKGKVVTLKGGYKADYSMRTGLRSILRGPLLVRSGALRPEYLVLR